jgi:hypothetical protein
MAAGGILVGGSFAHLPVAADDFRRAAADRHNFSQPQGTQVGDLQCSSPFIDVQQRMDTVVVKSIRIRQLPYPHTVHHNQNDPLDHRYKKILPLSISRLEIALFSFSL